MGNGSFDLDVSAEKTKLLTFFQLRTVMSSYSRGVLYATLFDPRLGEKPDWYDSRRRPFDRDPGAVPALV